jgi:two-component system sensor histidine kinase ChiS
LRRAIGGTVHIRITADIEYIHISIADNGVGMDDNKLQSLLENQPDKKRGIGLFNTDRRLKQIYGIGLHIESAVNQGTTVSFKIPK